MNFGLNGSEETVCARKCFITKSKNMKEV